MALKCLKLSPITMLIVMGHVTGVLSIIAYRKPSSYCMHEIQSNILSFLLFHMKFIPFFRYNENIFLLKFIL